MSQNTFQDSAFLKVFDARASKEKEKSRTNMIKIEHSQIIPKSFDITTKAIRLDDKGKILCAKIKNPRSKSNTSNGVHSNTELKSEGKLILKTLIDSETNSQVATLSPKKQIVEKSQENLGSPYRVIVKKNNEMEFARLDLSRRSENSMPSELVVKGGHPKALISNREPNLYSFRSDPFEDSNAESPVDNKREARRSESLEMEKNFRSFFKRKLKNQVKESSNNTTAQNLNNTVSTRATINSYKDMTSNESNRTNRGQSQDSPLKSKRKLSKKPNPYSLELQTGNSAKTGKFGTSVGIANTLMTPMHRSKKQKIIVYNYSSSVKKSSAINLYHELNKSIGIQSTKLTSVQKGSPEKNPLKGNMKQPKFVIKAQNNERFIEGYGSLEKNCSGQSPHLQKQLTQQQRLLKQPLHCDHGVRFSSLSQTGPSMSLQSTTEVEGDNQSKRTDGDIKSIEEQLEFESNSVRSSVSSIWEDTSTNELDHNSEEKKDYLTTIKRTIDDLLLRENGSGDQKFCGYAEEKRSRCYERDKGSRFHDKSSSPLRAAEQKKKKNYEEHINQLVNKLRPFSPPFSFVLTSLENFTNITPGKDSGADLDEKIAHQRTESSNSNNIDSHQGEKVLEVIYDPILNCYYNRKSNSYYRLKVD